MAYALDPAAKPLASMSERVIDAATRITAAEGWSAVTMSRLAQDVGVSRQTVYNVVGSKEELAKAVVLTELGRFLSVVENSFEEHTDSLVDAVRAATVGVLELAVDSRILRSVVAATHGSDTDLLPLLTTHAGPLLAQTRAVVAHGLRHYQTPLTGGQIGIAIDTVVRLVLSHAMQPSGSPEDVADELAWITGRIVGY
ncbi:TetR/AcrR family transcriptional regulator [Demetria terragena]|uniref:TetR/AcrR family transcriptional regulator n=1 Tax=Demetria terragena TaxID=63959 RepID=UPI001B7F8F5C|nr:TetR family transcriptional regulator [Demetria terragena]